VTLENKQAAGDVIFGLANLLGWQIDPVTQDLTLPHNLNVVGAITAGQLIDTPPITAQGPNGYVGDMFVATIAGIGDVFEVDQAGLVQTTAGTGGFDTLAAGALRIGPTNATSVVVNPNATFNGTITSGAITAPSISGSAAKLTTARNINGVAFDGSANITVTAAAGTLTGATLNATVLASSLTSVGVLAAPHFTSPVIDSGGLVITAGTIDGTAANSPLNIGTGAITSGLVNAQTISAAANFTGSLTVANGFTVTAGAVAFPVASIADEALSENVALLNESNVFSVGQIISSGGVNLGSNAAPIGQLSAPVAPTATANNGLVNLGSAGFAGGGGTNFVGSASGTFVAINSAVAYAGNHIDVQQGAGQSLFAVRGIANAVNGIAVILSATGNAAQISAQGSDANVPLQFNAKGNSNITVNAGSGGQTIFQANTTTKFTITAAATAWADAINMSFGTITGTKIGTATTQKLALYNQTPVVQAAAITKPASTASTNVTPFGYTTAAQADAIVTAVRTLIDVLGSTIGIGVTA
jgi:hypothetical protein